MQTIIQPVVLIIIKERNRILLTKRSEEDNEITGLGGAWQIPGGGLEFAETPEQTALREAREELGIEVVVHRVLPFIYTTVRGNWQGLLLPYECSRRFPEQEIVLNEEATTFTWANQQEAGGLRLTPFTNLIIDQVFGMS